VTITTEELEQLGIEKDVIKVIVEVIKLVRSAPDARLFAKYLWNYISNSDIKDHYQRATKN
jgi:hypothetical protein